MPLNLPNINEDKLKDIYKDATNYLTRYRGKHAIKQIEFNPQTDELDPTTYEVIRNETIVGVLAGDPHDISALRKDIAYISAIKGEVGQGTAVLARIQEEASRKVKHTRGFLYHKVYINLKNGHLSGNLTADSVWSHVEIDPDYTKAKEEEEKAKENYWRFNNLRDDLKELEYALKKILDNKD
jgi:hypothetical protein